MGTTQTHQNSIHAEINNKFNSEYLRYHLVRNLYFCPLPAPEGWLLYFLNILCMSYICMTIFRMWKRNTLLLLHYKFDTIKQYPFAAVPHIILQAFSWKFTRDTMLIAYNRRKVSCDRSTIRCALLEEHCTILVESEISLQGFS